MNVLELRKENIEISEHLSKIFLNGSKLSGGNSGNPLSRNIWMDFRLKNHNYGPPLLALAVRGLDILK